jgi:hypothetical protein
VDQEAEDCVESMVSDESNQVTNDMQIGCPPSTQGRHLDPAGANLIGDRSPPRQARHFDVRFIAQTQSDLAHDGWRAANLEVGDEQKDSTAAWVVGRGS